MSTHIEMEPMRKRIREFGGLHAELCGIGDRANQMMYDGLDLLQLVDLAKDWYDAVEDTVTEGSPAWRFMDVYREVFDVSGALDARS